ncbi:MarR family transcriptional regulator [Methanosarcina sp. KYL-1]|uniref:MarR family winged helix-turn-helix transcriptional regulator n=1 Tax=Methanosarcina sp. KYL-1 TaxID=2602068 RepID=UPI002100EA35|nr:MarR family transcriptional regulator [Methanosarcina sp. KYL-1]MCQ1536076.1 MarR family transcriptional regulator [Methanosarcina sp. KYL-1]
MKKITDKKREVERSDLDEKVDSLLEAGIRTLNKAYALEKEPVDLGNGVLLYPSEFHVIEVVGKYPEKNLTAIASHLGVTKGAISQMVRKLEKKGLVKKVRTPENKKNIMLELTGFGQEAFEWHRALHESLETGVREELARMSNAEIEKMLRVYGYFEKMLDRCLERYE